LVFAAGMMIPASDDHKGHRKNKLYGWLRRKMSTAAKQRIGHHNGMFGKIWVNDGTRAFVVSASEIGNWNLGRIRKHETRTSLRRTAERARKIQKMAVKAAFARKTYDSWVGGATIREIAKAHGLSHPSILSLWRTHIPEYKPT
jgi:AraC-like DNA-binding protein